MRLIDAERPYPHNVLEAITDQSFVIRYSKIHVLRHQTDADHVGRAVQIAICFMNDLRHHVHPNKFPVVYSRVLTRIAIHDNAESIFGDVTGDIKVDFPEFDVQEDIMLKKMWGDVIPKGLEVGVEELVLVSAVDKAELVMFCTDEVHMGNRAKSLTDCLDTGIRQLTELILKICGSDIDVQDMKTLNAILTAGLEAKRSCLR